MKALKELSIIVGVCLIGEVISQLLPFSFPPAVLSMLLMLLLFFTPLLKPEKIESVATLMLGNMVLFFIPSGVQIVKYTDIIKDSWWKLVIICLVSLVITFFVTGTTVMLTIKLMKRRKSNGTN
ncbi:MAG: CidA/LrgA family protein [Sphaerochaetaceae bacterium]|nr:CidA/LrgA family protein [Sphaerochaetaceae bacterium]